MRLAVLLAGVLAVALSLTACGESKTIRVAKKAVADQLRDPSSAQFRSLKSSGRLVVCGEVNGKNGYGAYSGFKRFYAVGDSAEIDPQDHAVPINGIPSSSDMFESSWAGYCR